MLLERKKIMLEDAKQFLDKLGEHIGVHKLKIILIEGDLVEGIVSEVGQDFITIIEEDFDTVIPISNIKLFRYSR